MYLQQSLIILILTLDEEIHIQRCLNSIYKLNCPIYIIDSGSKDETINIAKNYTNNIFFNFFESQKKQIEWFLKKETINDNKWILRLDADEYLPDKSLDKIRNLINNIDDKVGLINLSLQREFLGKHLKFGTLSNRQIPRIWKKSTAVFTEKNMDEKLKVKDGFKTINSNIEFFDASLLSPCEFVEKHLNYVDRQLLDIKLNVENKYSIRKKFYYALPFEISALLLFLYRYFFHLGFLDGREGFSYHFLQCFFYRNLIGMQKLWLENKSKK